MKSTINIRTKVEPEALEELGSAFRTIGLRLLQASAEVERVVKVLKRMDHNAVKSGSDD